MRIAFTGAAILVLSVLGSAAQAQTGTEAQVWQGEAFVTRFPSEAAQAACQGYAGIGDNYRVIDRSTIPGSPGNDVTQDEALTCHGSRNALRYYTGNGVSLNLDWEWQRCSGSSKV